MTNIRSILLLLAISSLALGGPAIQALESSPGEASPLLACFYECKDDSSGNWAQVTTLMVESMEPFPGQTTSMALIVRGGVSAQPAIGWMRFTLGPNDLDEINICRSLELAGVSVPEAGLIEILQRDVVLEPGSDTARVYAWVKNVLGVFEKTKNEPFDGAVSGVGKTECRVVPTTTEEMQERLQKTADMTEISPVLIENTLDPQIGFGR